MSTSTTSSVSSRAHNLISPSFSSQPTPTNPVQQQSFWSSALRATSNEALPSLADSVSLDELWEVYQVESVLAPLCVALIALSNLTLLVHEARVVWRTQRLIPPKLLVLALSSADLLATLVGFLPLWILFTMTTDVAPGGISPHNLGPSVNSSSSSSRSGVESATVLTSVASDVTKDIITASPKPSSSGFAKQPIVHTTGYLVVLFLLTAFWTLAQCIVVVMGVERFLALRTPFFYTARCTCGAFLVVLGVLTLLSCGIGGFHLVVHLEELQEQPLVFVGFLDSRSLAHNVFTLIQGLVWTVVLLACNWAVRRELRRMEERVTVMRMKDHSEYMKQLSMVHGAGREFARLMMAVNVIFLLSSYPNLVCVFLRLCKRPPYFSVQYFCWRMSHASALLNPFLYGFLRKSLRSRIRRFLNQHCVCLRPRRVTEVDAGPSVRYENEGVGEIDQNDQNARCHMTPSSTIMPRDPEASVVNLSLSE